jgi:hypothetical protein
MTVANYLDGLAEQGLAGVCFIAATAAEGLS